MPGSPVYWSEGWRCPITGPEIIRETKEMICANQEPNYWCSWQIVQVMPGHLAARYGYCKNLKKTVKIGQTQTRERKDNTRAGRMLSMVLEGTVDWKSTKQSIFATSSVEADYIAASYVSKEVVWVRKFIFGLGVVPIIEESIKMYCDNTGAITIANESLITKGVRHYHAKVHHLREVIEFGDVKIEKFTQMIT
ncbi:hypothetical protein Tco_0488972 [Tanacetum coccineum]